MKQDEQTYKRIEAYLNQEMKESDRALFEAEMQADPELDQFVRLQTEIDRQFSESDWVLLEANEEEKSQLVRYFASDEARDLEQKLSQIASSENTLLRKIKPWWWTAAAAAIGLLLLGIWFTNRPDNNTDLYIAYAQHQSLSLTEKGGDQTDSFKAEEAFNAGQYEEALPIIQDLISANDTIVDYRLWIAEGVCLLETNQFDRARDRFQALENSNALLQYEAAWYLALLSLKQRDLERAQFYLNDILTQENHPRFEEARDLQAAIKKIRD